MDILREYLSNLKFMFLQYTFLTHKMLNVHIFKKKFKKKRKIHLNEMLFLFNYRQLLKKES